MTMKRNRDLKAELGEAQIAAQNWEQKWAETEALRQNAVNYWVGQNTELRAELGQASRELMAVSEQLDVCRKERGEALDNLVDVQAAVLSAIRHPQLFTGRNLGTILSARLGVQLTEEGNENESEAMRKELDTICPKPLDARDHPVPQMVTSLGDWVPQHVVKKLEPLALTEDRTEAQLRADGDWVDEHEEEDPDLNDSDDFEVTQP